MQTLAGIRYVIYNSFNTLRLRSPRIHSQLRCAQHSRRPRTDHRGPAVNYSLCARTAAES